jgi:hypothetical protein
MKYKPTLRGFIAMCIIAALFVLMTFIESQPAHAGISLAEQRRQRERAEDMRHELELERIKAAALIEAAKYYRHE